MAKTLKEFNDEQAALARELHDRLAAAGHPVTPEEAKFLLVAGHVAMARTLGLDEGADHLEKTLDRLAQDLPKGEAERAAQMLVEA